MTSQNQIQPDYKSLFKNATTMNTKEVLQKLRVKPQGPQIFERFYPGVKYLDQAKKNDLWLENRKDMNSTSTEVLAFDQHNNFIHGDNFASTDYLGLSRHPDVIETAVEIANQFGVNSAGSPLAFGATKYFCQLRDQIGDLMKCHTLIYSSGWLAGFGVVKGYIRQADHVIIDEYVENCIKEGARAATKNVLKFRHLDEAHLEERISKIRQKDQDNGILIATSGFFSMDAQSPNLKKYQEICKKYTAVLLIDIHEDFGVLGKNGRGVWEDQLQNLDNIILFGSGSKAVGVNFGFVCLTYAKAAIQYLKYFSTAYMFTNAINPVQAACALTGLRLLRLHHGTIRRKQVLDNYAYLKKKMIAVGYRINGSPAPFVNVEIGGQILGRMVVKMMFDKGTHINLLEYPAVNLKQAKLRICLQPGHTTMQLDTLFKNLTDSIKNASEIYGKNVSPKL